MVCPMFPAPHPCNSLEDRPLRCCSGMQWAPLFLPFAARFLGVGTPSSFSGKCEVLRSSCKPACQGTGERSGPGEGKGKEPPCRPLDQSHLKSQQFDSQLTVYSLNLL